MEVKYIVHAKSPCAYCRMAVDLLRHEGAEFDYLNTELHEVPMLQEALMCQFGIDARQFPQIIKVEGTVETYIGGYTELRDSFAKVEDIDFD